MADPMSGPMTHCPWCSAELPDPTAERCPTCGAMLIASPDAGGEIKGVTTLDTEAILRARSEISRPRSNRILSFITGEVAEVPAPPENPDSIAPPDVEVRREMLRLRIAAESADLEAEAVALKADELARRGVHVSELAPAGPDEPPASPDAAPVAGVEEAAPSSTTPVASQEGGPGPEGSWPEELTPDAEKETPAGG